MSKTTDANQERYNYGYIKYGFDVTNAKMDEATVYYIKLLTPGTVGFIDGDGLYALDFDMVPIDYENVELTRQFNDETLFSTALKYGYLNQVLSIMNYVESFLKASEKDPRNLRHRAALYDIFKLDDTAVIQKLSELSAYRHKGLFEDCLTDRDFDVARQKASIIRRIETLLPVDFPQQPEDGRPGSWFGEFIKNKQFNLAEKYLKPYLAQYPNRDILIRDLSLTDSSVTSALKEMATKSPNSVFGRIHNIIKKLLPTDVYLTYVLNKKRYDLDFEDKQIAESEPTRQTQYSTPEIKTAQGHFAPVHQTAQNPGIFLSLMQSKKEMPQRENSKNKAGDDKMALFVWGQKQNNGK